LIPSDLAALKALVDAVERRRAITAALDEHQGACGLCRTGWGSAYPCGVVEMYAQLRSAVTAIAIALPAAQAALERVETVYQENVRLAEEHAACHKWNGDLVHQHYAFGARLDQLTRDVAYWRRRAEGAEAGAVQGEVRIGRLEKALARDRGCAECWKDVSCGADCRMNDVLEGRDE
jgi:hypothetical protein